MELFHFMEIVPNEQSSRKLLKCYRTAVSQTEIFSRTEGKSTGQILVSTDNNLALEI